MINVSAYGEEPEAKEFKLQAPQPLPKKQPPQPPVVKNWRGDEVIPLIRHTVPRSDRKPRRPWLLTTGAFLLACPGVAVGIVLCLTIVFSPLGAALMMVSTLPLHWILDRHSRKLDAWYDRDRPLDEDTVKPWETKQP